MHASYSHFENTVKTLERRAGTREVRELLDAAGPLTVQDIAGGLNVSVREAWQRVRLMVDLDCLKQDEFERFRLRAAA